MKRQAIIPSFLKILPEIQRNYISVNLWKTTNTSTVRRAQNACFICFFLSFLFPSTTGKHDGQENSSSSGRKEEEENDDGVPTTFTVTVQKSGVRRSLSLFSVRRQTFTVQSPVSDVHCHCSVSDVRRSLFRVRCQTFTVTFRVWCQTFTVQSPV